MSINSVSISGNITRDAELRQTASGMAVLGFSVAVNDRRKNAQTDQWEDYPNFIDCSMFGTRAERIAQYLVKGTKVAVLGKLRWSQWERDGQKRSKIEVIVDEIEFMSRQQGQLGSEPVYGAPAAATAPSQQPYQQQMGGMPQAVGPVTGTIYDDDIPF